MERQWYRFTYCGVTYEVFASSPDAARSNFLLWYRMPVEVDWLRRVYSDSVEAWRNA